MYTNVKFIIPKPFDQPAFKIRLAEVIIRDRVPDISHDVARVRREVSCVLIRVVARRKRLLYVGRSSLELGGLA